MSSLLVFAHSFIEPIVNLDQDDCLIKIPAPVSHHYANYSDYDQNTFSATAEHGTAKGFYDNREHHDYIVRNIDFNKVSDFLLAYHSDVTLKHYQYWTDKTQAQPWLLVPWLTHPSQNHEFHETYQSIVGEFADTAFNILPVGAIAYDLLEHDVSPDVLFTDPVGHPTPHLSDLCRQYVRSKILGIPAQNTIIFSRISEKYPEKLQGNQ